MKAQSELAGDRKSYAEMTQPRESGVTNCTEMKYQYCNASGKSWGEQIIGYLLSILSDCLVNDVHSWVKANVTFRKKQKPRQRVKKILAILFAAVMLASCITCDDIRSYSYADSTQDIGEMEKCSAAEAEDQEEVKSCLPMQ